MVYTLTRSVNRICVKRCQAKTYHFISFLIPTDAILKICALQYFAVFNVKHLTPKILQVLSQ